MSHHHRSRLCGGGWGTKFCSTAIHCFGVRGTLGESRSTPSSERSRSVARRATAMRVSWSRDSVAPNDQRARWRCSSWSACCLRRRYDPVALASRAPAVVLGDAAGRRPGPPSSASTTAMRWLVARGRLGELSGVSQRLRTERGVSGRARVGELVGDAPIVIESGGTSRSGEPPTALRPGIAMRAEGGLPPSGVRAVRNASALSSTPAGRRGGGGERGRSKRIGTARTCAVGLGAPWLAEASAGCARRSPAAAARDAWSWFASRMRMLDWRSASSMSAHMASRSRLPSATASAASSSAGVSAWRGEFASSSRRLPSAERGAALPKPAERRWARPEAGRALVGGQEMEGLTSGSSAPGTIGIGTRGLPASAACLAGDARTPSMSWQRAAGGGGIAARSSRAVRPKRGREGDAGQERARRAMLRRIARTSPDSGSSGMGAKWSAEPL